MCNFKSDFLQLLARTVIMTNESSNSFPSPLWVSNMWTQNHINMRKPDRKLWGPNSAGLQLKCQYWDKKILKSAVSCAVFRAHTLSWLSCGGVRSHYMLNCWAQKQYRRWVTLRKAMWIRRRPANYPFPNITELHNFRTLWLVPTNVIVCVLNCCW